MSAAATRVQIYAATADAAFAEKIALALHRHGCEIVNGAFDPATSDAVIVLWSDASARSSKLIEAARGPQEAGVLVPVSIGRASPPKGFDHLAPMELAGWGGDSEDPRWRFVLDEVDRTREAAPQSVLFPSEASPEEEPLMEGPAEAPAPPREEPEHPPARVSAPLAAPKSYAPVFTSARRFRPTPALIFAFTLVGAVIFGGFVALVSSERQAARETAAAAIIAESAAPEPRDAAEKAPEAPVIAAIAPAETPPTEEAPADAAQSPVEETDAIAALIAEHDGETAPAEDNAPAGEPAAAPPVKSGELFRDCATCPEMAAIAPGTFNFGSPSGEHSRQAAEGPVVEVKIAAPFALGTREVTFEEWDACVAAGGCQKFSPPAGWGRGKQPVINVSWRDAKAYTAWLSESTGKAYRLPSEAEWEYAARAGATTPFSFGESVAPAQANFDGSLPYKSNRGTNRRRPIAVGSFAANPFGLYDMHGNVWEWTEDCWNANHQGAPADGSAASGTCTSHVLKGGAWNTGGWRLRAGHRIGKNQNAREFDNGFRVARDLD